MSKYVESVSFDDMQVANSLFGVHNAHLDLLAKESGVGIASRGMTLSVSADTQEEGELVLSVLVQCYGLVRAGYALQGHDLVQAYVLLTQDRAADLQKVWKEEATIHLPKRSLTARNMSQRAYLRSLKQADMTFGIGPAGTGKTYLAVAVAVSLLSARRIKRLILTRPAVEAGEKLGFLPGDLADKVNPYLRPLYDALHDTLGFDKTAAFMESGLIEIAPLAFMRGRTLNDAFIILDEAQNTTKEQMKMFLTRLGFGSRAAITGDITQIDLPSFAHEQGAERSGLIHAMHVLSKVQGIHFCQFTSADVVRHPLVGRIVHAYDAYEKIST